jgi:hypothetical protein
MRDACMKRGVSDKQLGIHHDSGRMPVPSVRRQKRRVSQSLACKKLRGDGCNFNVHPKGDE